MESALGWLGDLFRALASLVPTWHHVECVDVAVMVKRGDRVRALEPGVWWYWPFWTTLYHRARVRQTKNLLTQTLLTKDGVAVAAGGMVRYQIDDAITALVETHDVDQAIEDEVLAVLCEYVTTRTVESIQQDRSAVNTELTRKARSVLRSYGVAVERAQLTDFAPGRTLIHVGHVGGFGVAEEE